MSVKYFVWFYGTPTRSHDAETEKKLFWQTSSVTNLKQHKVSKAPFLLETHFVASHAHAGINDG
jgi:hypothetical protein